MTEEEFWQFTYLVALHRSGSTVDARACADMAVKDLIESREAVGVG